MGRHRMREAWSAALPPASDIAVLLYCGRDPRAYRWGTVHIAVRIERAR